MIIQLMQFGQTETDPLGLIFNLLWFALIFVFIMLIMVAGNMFGATDIGTSSAFKGVILAIIVIILVAGVLINIRQQTDVPDEITEESDFSNIINVLFHPKFIGMVFILVVAVFTIALLAAKPL